MFWLRPPKLALRALMLGPNAPNEIVNEVRAAIATVRPKVLASRVKAVLSLDCRDALRACTAPVMYLAGAKDVLVRRRSLDAIKAIKSGIKVCTVDGPHLQLQREPLQAWNQIETFLNEVIPRDIGAIAL
jgi:surfactin synthase thioesterase subunit